jgi:glycosyltransferase involved in cell wall biosynthesis
VAEWHLITGEYPPQPGGVSDYTHLVAAGLAAAGDAVHVWCPPAAGRTPAVPGVTAHRELGRMRPADLARVDQLLGAFPGPRRLVLQWVPHSFGRRAVNLPFCWWLWRRARRHGDRVELMVHEPFLTLGGSWKQHGAAAVQRLMATLLLLAADRVWVAILAWRRLLRPYALGRRLPFAWLPVPSNVPVVADPAATAAARAPYARPGGLLLGHFGTYADHVGRRLAPVLASVLGSRPDTVALLLGRGSNEFGEQFLLSHAELRDRVYATGPLDADTLSCHLSACDLLVQPFGGGASSRNASLMAGLAHGKPVVTTCGRLTEPLWRASRAVVLVPEGEPAGLAAAVSQLCADPAARRRLGTAAAALYRDHFALEHTVTALRRSAP